MPHSRRFWRRTRLAPQQSQLTFALADVVAHSRLSDRRVREFRQDPTMNPPCRVALLTRGAAVLVEHPLDERLKPAQLRLAPFRVTVRRWQRTGNRPANNAPMNTELRRHARSLSRLDVIGSALL
jgi:hypothetical protein